MIHVTASAEGTRGTPVCLTLSLAGPWSLETKFAGKYGAVQLLTAQHCTPIKTLSQRQTVGGEVGQGGR